MGAHNGVADIVAELQGLAAERRPDDELLRSFLSCYYRELPDEDADERSTRETYGSAVAHLSLGRIRPPGELLVRVLSPDYERDGWHSDRSLLLFVTDDVPFLVDTVRMVLDRYELGIHLLVHPMLCVERDEQDRIVSISASARTDDPKGVEAWTQVEIDRCPPEVQERLERDVRSAITHVHRVVEDFEEMRDRMLQVGADDELVVWLAGQHFVVLGAATFDRTPDGLVAVEGSELGEFRPDIDAHDEVHPDVIDPPSMDGDQELVIARTGAVSRIHRPARMTCVSIRPAGTDREYRFLGLLGSGAYRESVFAIPVLGDRARDVLVRADVATASHTGRAMKNVVETLPRDTAFELDVDALARLVVDIVGLQERRIVRVFDVAEPVGPWTTVLVYIPRGRFADGVAEKIATLVAERYGGETRDLERLLGESSLARISMTVRAVERVDLDSLAEAIDDLTTTWSERAEEALVEALGDLEGRRVFAAVHAAVPSDYQARVRPAAAVGDLVHVAQLTEATLAGRDDTMAVLRPREATELGILTSLGRSVDADPGHWRFRVFVRGRSSTLSDLVPLLEHLGLHAIDERPATFDCPGTRIHLHDIGVRVPVPRIDDQQLRELQHTFVGLMTGTIEADGLNQLVLAAGLECRQVKVLRLYHRYLRQAGFPFSPGYIERSIVRNPEIAADLARLFDTRFDPRRFADAGARGDAVAEIRSRVASRLDAIPSLDDDRICRAFLTLIDATIRTNAFRGRTELAVKLQPEMISFLPEPRPMFEIFVCSPWVEGVHLRGGPIARGGLRWSDRPEDFRTEVLGLVKAQMVKNAVIVPVGAKGGFVVKQDTADPADREAFRAQGIDRYERFVRALLDVTDNLDGTDVVPPPKSVIYDAPDPYLVVAADKGTASFSDIANSISAAYGFWLGDAFASGGSQGYDHKAMGITARGAWESVRRHVRVLGKDIDVDELTVVGIGDMSGDVFGNGMLLSEHLKIVAAFDHRHVFLDPDPDPSVAFAERRRLFDMPRSSWADYDADLISPGGGVHPRSAKSVPITPEVAAALGLTDAPGQMRPDDLISAILRAPVDLLWNGGIGTYVKASAETHEMVSDRANDSVRVDAVDLRCRIVGEGGNLGLTQLARAEFAVSGGLVYTDAIDNSAGVDCSDHEVNIKVLLDGLVREGELTGKQRNQLLEEMTDEVAELVLVHNRAQTLALLIARRQSLSMVNVHARYLDTLAADGHVDRVLDGLPTDKQIAERQSAGSGLRAPEFAVMIASTKNSDVQEILTTDLPDDPVLEADLMAYFPSQLCSRYPNAIRDHRLRREIIATSVVNNMVNLAGISFGHRMTEDSGAAIGDVARAFVASRNIFGFTELWREIDSLDSAVDLDTQVDVFLDARRMAERGTIWLLRHRHSPLDLGKAIEDFSPGIRYLSESLDFVVAGRVADDISRLREQRIEAGVPADLAARAARWPWLHSGFDIVELAQAELCSITDAAEAYWSVFRGFDLGWLWDGIGVLPRSDRWQTQARSVMRDDLLTVVADLARTVIVSADGSLETWMEANERSVARALAMHTEIRRAESFNLTTLSVALRQLRNLSVSAVAAGARRDDTSHR
jgi:glutamate dehydrogenase